MMRELEDMIAESSLIQLTTFMIYRLSNTEFYNFEVCAKLYDFKGR